MGNDWASLHKACRENNEAVIREHSGLAGSSDYNEETCYHSAAFSGARTTCELLYELGGLNVNHPNNFFTFPSQIACYRDNVEVLRWLVEKDPACLDVLVRKREVGGTFFYGQYVDGKYDYGSLCVKQFGHKLIRDSLLHICIRVKATKCIAFLLSLPSVQPHALNHFGDTPRDVDSFLFDGIVQIAQEGQMLQSNRTVQSNTVVWKPDASASLCRVCLSQFNLFNRRHHCRICGAVVCDECSPHQGEGSIMPGMPLEVCARIEAKELQRLCSRFIYLIVLTLIYQTFLLVCSDIILCSGVVEFSKFNP